MKIAERDSVSIQHPQSGRLYEVGKGASDARTVQRSQSNAGDGIALNAQNQLQAFAMTAGQGDRASFVESLRAQVSSGQYQLDPTALSKSLISGMLRGY